MKELRTWGNAKYNNVEPQIQELIKDIFNVIPERDCLKESLARSELIQILKAQETYWMQRSRIQWLLEGDKNTAFFHWVASNRKTNITILGLYSPDDNWMLDIMQIHDTLVQHYRELFHWERTSTFPWDNLINGITLTSTEANTLSVLPFEMEIHEALRSLSLWKSPSSDWFPLGFYQNNWELFKDELSKLKHDLL